MFKQAENIENSYTLLFQNAWLNNYSLQSIMIFPASAKRGGQAGVEISDCQYLHQDV